MKAVTVFDRKESVGRVSSEPVLSARRLRGWLIDDSLAAIQG